MLHLGPLCSLSKNTWWMEGKMLLGAIAPPGITLGTHRHHIRFLKEANEDFYWSYLSFAYMVWILQAFKTRKHIFCAKEQLLKTYPSASKHILQPALLIKSSGHHTWFLYFHFILNNPISIHVKQAKNAWQAFANAQQESSKNLHVWDNDLPGEWMKIRTNWTTLSCTFLLPIIFSMISCWSRWETIASGAFQI